MSEFMDALDRSDLVRKPLPRVLSLPVSRPGIDSGTLFAVLTLFPSMLPRSGITQGVVLGITFMVGYPVGAGWQWICLAHARGD